MFLNEVMEERRKICNSENGPIWATPENLPFFKDEILLLFSYSYGSKVPKWKCAHNLLCKKYKNCLKLIKIAVLQLPDWIQRKKTPCMLDGSLTSEVWPGAGWWPPLDPNSGLLEPEPRSEVCSVTRVSAASSSRESSRPRPFSMYLPSLSNSVPYRLTFIWKYHKCANTLYKYWSITDNIGLKYIFFYFNFFEF